MKCGVTDCSKPAEKRGWCGMHYRRWRLNGDVNVTKKRANGAGYQEGGYLGHQLDGIKVFDHVAIAERALGRKLPPGAVVHHVNEDRADNRNENLVICPSRAYHNLIHARMAALAECGDANWKRCRHCGRHDDPSNLHLCLSKGREIYWHRECANAYNRGERRAA